MGHATRCIPIIKHLLQSGCKVIIAAEGKQENLLKTEFPNLQFVHLPGYRIHYSKSKRLFSLKIIFQIRKILSAIKKEQVWLKKVVETYKVDAVISDNRYGLYSTAVPCVFITHQLTIKAPIQFAEKLLRNINYDYINRFTSCWVPDEKGSDSLAGELSQPPELPSVPVNYLGPISRLNTLNGGNNHYDILVLISGPEPQRTALEQKLLQQLKSINKKVLFVRGLPGSNEKLETASNIAVANHLNVAALEKAMASSAIVISRSGYTTVMELCRMQKRAILIPTPGQTEQEYLATYLQQKKWALAADQDLMDVGELLKKAEEMDFQFPHKDMEHYKKVVDTFLQQIKAEWKVGV